VIDSLPKAIVGIIYTNYVGQMASFVPDAVAVSSHLLQSAGFFNVAIAAIRLL